MDIELEKKNAKNDAINKCLEIIKNSIRENCSDHTPYRGACVTCGRHDNFELISNPDDLIKEIEKQLE